MKKHLSPYFFLLALAITQGAGILGSFFTRFSIGVWYAMLDKPHFQPPNWLFGPVWFVLYTLMAGALFVIWRKRNTCIGRDSESIYIQLLLNILWSAAFFAIQNPLAGYVVIMVMIIHLLVIMRRFFLEKLELAAWLLMPYLLWVVFASILNFSLVMLNL